MTFTAYINALTILENATTRVSSTRGMLKLLSAMRHVRAANPEYSRFIPAGAN